MVKLRWFVVAVAVAVLGVGCKRKKAKPPPRKRIVKRKVVMKAQLPRGVKVRPQEVLIRPKPFTMGSNDGTAPGARMEAPAHKVSLQYVFAMWRQETSQKEFKELMGYNPSRFKKCGETCPVENVNWHEAAYYMNLLSKKYGLSTCFQCTGKHRNAICKAHPYFQGKRYYQCNGYRLATEAEWEYGARAGSTGMYYKVPKSKNVLEATIDRIAWYGKTSRVGYAGGFSCSVKVPGIKDPKCGIHPQGTKLANPWDLHDMLGNVSEWVYDRYGAYSQRSLVNPVGPISGRRIFRGCNWFHKAQECRVTRRFFASPSLRNNLIGFRPVRTLVMVRKDKKAPKNR